MQLTEFDAAFRGLPEGYSQGVYEGRRFGLTVRRSEDGRRNSLFARELAGTDLVSFNLYRLSSGKTSLKPCEMSAEKVVSFVLGFQSDRLEGESAV
ncbi:MAG: hypothetical protein DI606_03205 [Sphingobium sp.]|jgi:hypothetical protein|uniref:hypothetical protein n=1 Tax=Sphingomonas sp. S2M10 TaxID=2705010 RepID=UPI000DB28780|nr:hypothetical protein [Sphingomonas sp. S2M10]NLS28415.1 hypothetical protein [Sphingomonas sp. S2M10]PZU14255.1 MAG: hypothetical protein DI606_03205 [Sphingobium sp.]